MCRSAVEANLMGVSITDHCEIGSPEYADFKYTDRSIAEIRAAQEAFMGQLRVTMGIELGQAHHDPDQTKRLFESRRFDFVIGSLHMLRGYEDFYFVDYERTDLRLLLSKYYEELGEMAELGFFDVMGHINYPLRYVPAHIRERIDLSEFDSQIRGILQEIARRGKGIEINTSGLRRGPNETFPSFKYLRMFREAGGEIVTIGSDAHTVRDVGAGIVHGMNILVEAGFKYFAFYRGRQPVMLKLI